MVNDSLSDNETNGRGSEGVNRSASSFSYTETFYKAFPYYLSIGMSEEQYWDKDPMLAKYYREADELRKERVNQEAWLQGMYIYDALARISPIMSGFAKKGTKAKPYVEQPYPLSHERTKTAEEKKEKLKYEKGKRYMEAFMTENNKRFDERK